MWHLQGQKSEQNNVLDTMRLPTGVQFVHYFKHFFLFPIVLDTTTFLATKITPPGKPQGSMLKELLNLAN